MRNPLNGAALNLEVARRRAAAGGAPDSIAAYATIAQHELHDAVALIEALLALARPAAGAIDLYGCVEHLATLLGAAFASEEGRLVLGSRPDVPAETGAGAAATRLALALGFELAMRRPAEVRVGVLIESGAVTVRVQVAPPPSEGLAYPEAARAALAAAGITVASTRNAISIAFPPTGGHSAAASVDDGTQDSHRG